MTGGMDNPVDVAFTATGERILSATFVEQPQLGKRDGLLHAVYGGVYGKPHAVIDDHKRTGDLMPVMAQLGPAVPAGLTRYGSATFGDGFRDNFFAAMFTSARSRGTSSSRAAPLSRSAVPTFSSRTAAISIPRTSSRTPTAAC